MVEQIKEILLSRIDGINVFDQNAVNLCAQKISAYSGDIRRSLALARRAVEIFKSKSFTSRTKGIKEKVDYTHIMMAYQELLASKNVKVLKSLRKYEILLVSAL
jgi:origin recognition complex subunit 1